MARVSIIHLGKDAPPQGRSKEPTRILGDVSLEIADGEFLVLVGPSGCGKTTLLRCIAGLETPTRGELQLDGERVNEQEPRERDIAMVFQSYALYPHLTVRDNLAFGLRMRKTPQAEIRKRVDEAAAMLEIAQYLDRFPRQLSGGQRQRVAMGRAVVRRPRVFLFDEPLSNLDAALRGQMRVELKRLHARLGATMVYVTHDQVEAMTLADRIAVLRAGAVEQVGSPSELYGAPANLFVARFLGMPEMNTLPGRVSGKVLEVAGATVGIEGLPPGEVTVGMRAEDVTLRDPTETLTPGALEIDAEVDVVENLGWDSLVHLRARVDSETRSVVARVESVAAPREKEQVRISCSGTRLHVFDASGKRCTPAAVAKASA